MRKQDAACPLPILGLVLTQPQDLWSGIACAHRVPDKRDDAGRAAPKILWLRQNEPENWKRTRSILLPHDYLNLWLTGAKKMEFGDASGTALLDVKTRQWSMKLVDYIADDLSEKLPLLISS